MKMLMLALLFSVNTYAQKNAATPAAKVETKSAKTMVVIQTTAGDIEVELNGEKAPNTVANFLKYVEKKHYDGLIFHRVINGFMVQGGGFDKNMNEKKADAPIQNEANNGLRNDVGTIAMARMSDPHSASAQFFINVEDNTFLNYVNSNGNGWGYAVFGKVTNGMSVVNKIKMAKTGMVKGMGDVPLEAIEIKSIKRK